MTICGALRRYQRLQPGLTLTSQPNILEMPRQAATATLIEGKLHKRAPLDDQMQPGTRRHAGDGRAIPLIQGTCSCSSPEWGRPSENSVVSIKNKSFSVTAGTESRTALPVIIAQGGCPAAGPLYALCMPSSSYNARHPRVRQSSPTHRSYWHPSGADGVRLRRRRGCWVGRRRRPVRVTGTRSVPGCRSHPADGLPRRDETTGTSATSPAPPRHAGLQQFPAAGSPARSTVQTDLGGTTNDQISASTPDERPPDRHG